MEDNSDKCERVPEGRSDRVERVCDRDGGLGDRSQGSRDRVSREDQRNRGENGL